MKRPDDASVPDLDLERHRLGELPEDEGRRIEELLAVDGGLKNRLDALEHSDAETSRRHPAALMAKRIRQRARAARLSEREDARANQGRTRLMPALAAAAVVLAVGVTVGRLPSTDDGVRLKGAAPELVVYRKTSGGSERLGPGAFTVPGDLVRIGYRAAGRAYGVILSTDGNGHVTLHLPRAGRHAAPLQPGGTVLLDFSYELDDAPRWERFYLVTADVPFDLECVREAARDAAAAGSETVPPILQLPAEFGQTVFTLRKESLS